MTDHNLKDYYALNDSKTGFKHIAESDLNDDERMILEFAGAKTLQQMIILFGGMDFYIRQSSSRHKSIVNYAKAGEDQVTKSSCYKKGIRYRDYQRWEKEK